MKETSVERSKRRQESTKVDRTVMIREKRKFVSSLSEFPTSPPIGNPLWPCEENIPVFLRSELQNQIKGGGCSLVADKRYQITRYFRSSPAVTQVKKGLT